MSKLELTTEGGTKYFMESMGEELWDLAFTGEVQYITGEKRQHRKILEDKYLISIHSKEELIAVKNLLTMLRS